MCVFEEVLLAEDSSEAEDLSEDVALTRELARFANFQLGSRARTLEDLVKALFGDSARADCIRCMTRPDRAGVLLTLGVLTVLKGAFFSEGYRLSSV